MEDSVQVEQRKAEASDAQDHWLTKPSQRIEKITKRKGLVLGSYHIYKET